MCRENDYIFDNKQNILILDDDESFLQFYSSVISKKLPLCTLKTFSKVNEKFYKYVDFNNVDLYIMDVELGDCNSIEISKNLIEKHIHRNGVFLFISGYDYDIDSFCHLKGKCIYDYMSKPFTVDVFIAAVTSLMNISYSHKSVFESAYNIDNIRQKYFEKVKKDREMIDDMLKDCKYLNIERRT